MGWVQLVFVFLLGAVLSQAELAAENLTLRRQLAVLKQRTGLLLDMDGF